MRLRVRWWGPASATLGCAGTRGNFVSLCSLCLGIMFDVPRFKLLHLQGQLAGPAPAACVAFAQATASYLSYLGVAHCRCLTCIHSRLPSVLPGCCVLQVFQSAPVVASQLLLVDEVMRAGINMRGKQ
jgi:hypothetical protein